MAKAKGAEAAGEAEADAAKGPVATGAAEAPVPETAQPEGFVNEIPLSARLPQRLVLTVNRYQAQIVKAVKPYGIGASEYPVLITLRHRELDGVNLEGSSQRDIAKRQHRDPALINRVAKSLEAKGLITQEVDNSN
ncbi:MarR family winged helix-turn-helix transcriptional regulator [Adlercreutzia mucosicola]|uniref:MarR family transcriptional regulator n=1 Tax=Adlercreutzia mucosicola TaxID=580026 RepID=A0A6N8JP48_9ACTN|nr:MarR family transcriptional regulator [Adlercreutzia mucosicola]MEB1814288.1 MarR family transcriptional regulator [Adlercreutzia mucosicola]MVX61651.1 MarR family transcriptional regulator [Adlercreutzia mucosicola]